MPTTCGGAQAQGQVQRPMPWCRVEEPGDTATELSSEESFVDVSRPRHTQTGEQGPMPWLTLFSCSTAGCRNVRMRGGTEEKEGEGGGKGH